jgi:hypothetical protein
MPGIHRGNGNMPSPNACGYFANIWRKWTNEEMLTLQCLVQRIQETFIARQDEIAISLVIDASLLHGEPLEAKMADIPAANRS